VPKANSKSKTRNTKKEKSAKKDRSTPLGGGAEDGSSTPI